MEKVDARSLSPKAQERIRQLAVKAVLDGAKQVEVAKLYGVTRRAVAKWLKSYRDGGFQALTAKPKGRPKGGSLLPWQSAQIAKAVVDHHPEQLTRFIHEGAEGRLSRLCFGAKKATRGVGEGGRSLGGSFFDKNTGRDTPRVDFGRSYPPGLSRTDGGSGVNRGWPAGFATARPRGRGKDNPRPGAPRCGGWSPGCGPRFFHEFRLPSLQNVPVRVREASP